MKIPFEIIGAEVNVADRYMDHHIARRMAYLSVAEKLAQKIANKAFVGPTIIRAEWYDGRDPFLDLGRVQCRMHVMPFKDWAIEHLRAGNVEFGSILDIPLTNERMMVERDMGIFYTK